VKGEGYMSYGLMIHQGEMEILEQHNINYNFWDINELIEGSELVEIEFYSEQDYLKAKKLLNK
jgi:hypothetical protein